MKIAFQMSCLTLFQECQPIPLTGFQSTARGDVLNFDELMHKDCRNSWKCKKNKITVSHEACSWVGAKFRFYQLQTCKKFGFTQRHKLVGKCCQKIIYEKICRPEWHALHGLQPAF